MSTVVRIGLAPGEVAAHQEISQEVYCMMEDVGSLETDQQRQLRQQYQRTESLLNYWQYKAGRFLYNEAQQISDRSHRFDINTLEDEVSKCTGYTPVVATRLYREGSHSRLLQMTLKDHRKIIIKIPFRPQPKHYATASEVATLSFLRSRGVPVPKVYGWSSNASGNKVGIEYIIMEKAKGHMAESQFQLMEKRQLERMVSSFVDIEKYVFALPFGAFGSIYFKDDIPAESRLPLLQTDDPVELRDTRSYCIGPIAEPFFWRGNYRNLTPEHGPWKTCAAYLESVGRHAEHYMTSFTQPARNKFPYNSMFEPQTDPQDQTELLQKYTSISTLVQRTADSTLHRPILRHPALSARNLFLCPSTHTIFSITNWRHTTILPFVAVAGCPPHLFDKTNNKNGGSAERPPPSPATSGTRRRGLSNAETKATCKQSETRSTHHHAHHAQLLHHCYRACTSTRNQVHAQILDILPVILLQRLLRALQTPWTGVKNIILLKGALISLTRNWQELSTGSTCPLTFTLAEIDGQAQDEELYDDAEELVNYIKRELGIDESGWVSHERFEHVKKRNWELKEEWMAQAANIIEERQVDDGWMFQDDEVQNSHSV